VIWIIFPAAIAAVLLLLRWIVGSSQPEPCGHPRCDGRVHICHECNGTGEHPYYEDCPECNGEGSHRCPALQAEPS